MAEQDNQINLGSVPIFFVCRTCGSYISVNDFPQILTNGGYCSEACSDVYTSCITCGRYVRQAELYNEHFCSPDCATQYVFLRSLGNKPVIFNSQSQTGYLDLP